MAAEPRDAQASPARPENRFQCNVCLDAAKDPVVTQYVCTSTRASSKCAMAPCLAPQMWSLILLGVLVSVDFDAKEHMPSVQGWGDN